VATTDSGKILSFLKIFMMNTAAIGITLLLVRESAIAQSDFDSLAHQTQKLCLEQDWKQVEENLAQLKSKRGKSKWIPLFEAHLSIFRDKKYKMGLEKLNQYEKEFGRDPAVSFLRATVFLRERSYSDLYTLTKEMITYYPQDFRSWIVQSWSFSKANRLESLLKAYLRSPGAEERSFVLQKLVGEGYIDLAATLAQSDLFFHPTNRTLQSNLLKIYEHQENWEEHEKFTKLFAENLARGQKPLSAERSVAAVPSTSESALNSTSAPSRDVVGASQDKPWRFELGGLFNSQTQNLTGTGFNANLANQTGYGIFFKSEVPVQSKTKQVRVGGKYVLTQVLKSSATAKEISLKQLELSALYPVWQSQSGHTIRLGGIFANQSGDSGSQSLFASYNKFDFAVQADQTLLSQSDWQLTTEQQLAFTTYYNESGTSAGNFKQSYNFMLGGAFSKSLSENQKIKIGFQYQFSTLQFKGTGGRATSDIGEETRQWNIPISFVQDF